jgi:hypothetical protein
MIDIDHLEPMLGIGDELVMVDPAIVVGIDAVEPDNQSVRTSLWFVLRMLDA